jgi:hypothetical protein
MNIEKIEVLTKERQNIILQMKHEKINNNDKNILKSLKNNNKSSDHFDGPLSTPKLINDQLLSNLNLGSL